MDSVALDWHKEIKPMHEDIRNMQATEAKKKNLHFHSVQVYGIHLKIL